MSYGSAFDTGVYAIEPESLAALDTPGVGDAGEGEAELIHTARQRVWQALNEGDFEPPRIPTVATEVLRVSENPDCSAAGITRLLHQDAFIAGSVLQVANTAHYGPRSGKRITQLQRAVARLGVRRTRDIVLAAGLRQTIYSGPHAALMRTLWQAAVGTAVAMNLLAGVAGKNSEQAFVIGLLHDVGKPVLAGVLERVVAELEGPIEFEELADEVFHLMHARAGAAIINGWGLPKALAELVDHHHDPVPPRSLQEPGAFLRLADLIYEVWLARGDELHAADELRTHRLVARLDIGDRAMMQVLALYPGALEGMLIT